MEKKLNNIFKDILKIVFIICVVLSMTTSKVVAVSDNIQNKKAIVLIVDEISLVEILNSYTPNIDTLLENGAMGFMNIRAKSSLSNRGSTYLSLGMGVRTSASSRGGLAFQRDQEYPLTHNSIETEDIAVSDIYKLYTGKQLPDGEVINVSIRDIEKTALDITPNNQVGLLGKIAREEGIITGIVGNSDLSTPAREATMLAMDENGAIPFGYVDSDLLISDASVLGGVKLNQERLLEEVEDILPYVNMLFIDYGDTVRVQKASGPIIEDIRKEQKIKAIERADSFLGQVMNKVDQEKTLFMIITPNPSPEMVSQGNFGLTPIVMSGPNIQRGLLTSNTTRREGLVTNFDFSPTLLSFFGITESRGFIGETMKVAANDNPAETLLKNQEQNLYLRKYRRFFHNAFIILIGITLIGFYLPKFTKWKGLPGRILNYLSLTVMIVPLMMMTVSLIGYKSITFDLIYVFGGAFIISYVLNKIFNQKLLIMAIVALLTSGLLLTDVFVLQKLMIISPLGSDAIAGGRFYGIGNDYMGILLGSTLLGFFSLFHLYKTKKSVMVVSMITYMLLAIVGLSPFFGANMGGTLSAMLSTLLILLVIFDRKLSFKKIAIIGVGVVLGILLVARLDTLFNPNPSHAGKALESLMVGGWNKFFEIIGSKLKQVLWNLVNSPWNIILFSQLILGILLYRYKGKILMEVRENFWNLYKGFTIILFCGVAVFLFNDTGTIAAALELSYLFIPLGVVLNNIDRAEIL
ncbi:hypothetical protein RBU61_19010 [Tissierella sp. MB52-C2]|uniref:hypothetical protein n=1 Tax=Tissierella sp. MB52-C2 TaxID=3070999 RepID=UPI00280BC064|nr:hypothetical protein [Tissierella sp. MB52-C2]WMM24992.1 hypothetical protein RBU61_19010 [Tissierella sp. MB52-C2]